MDRRSFLKILGVVVTPLPALVPWALPRGTAIRFLHEGEVVADDYPVQNFTVPSTMKACLDYTHAPSGFCVSLDEVRLVSDEIVVLNRPFEKLNVESGMVLDLAWEIRSTPVEWVHHYAQRVLAEQAKKPPKQRFREMIESGLIDEEGRLLRVPGGPQQRSF